MSIVSIHGPMKGTGQANYYLELAREDYYLSGGEPPGLWFGKGADALGLKGTVDRKTFRNLLSGFSPDKSVPLVQNAGGQTRQSGWDFTLSAPKALSVLWGCSGDEGLQRKIQDIDRRAVEKTLSIAEEKFGLSRTGKNGSTKVEAGLVWALFHHGTSRAQDPQLHTHAILINVGVRPDRTTGTLHTKELYRHKLALGAIYHAELAAGLSRELGVQIESRRVGFGIAGVPQELCDAFSKRRSQIEALLKQRGEHSAVAAKIAALQSRDKKTNVPREKLFPAWREIASAHGWTQKHMKAVVSNSVKASRLPVEDLYDQLVKGKKENETPQKLFFRATWLAQRIAANADDIDKAISRYERASGRRPFLSISRKLLFPNAPDWSPVKKWSLPVIVIGAKKPKHTWGKVMKEARVKGAVIQLRKRILFPRAPKWSLARKLQLPAVKVWTGKFAKKKPEHVKFPFPSEKQMTTIPKTPFRKEKKHERQHMT